MADEQTQEQTQDETQEQSEQTVQLVIDEDGPALPISGEVTVTEDEEETLSTNIANKLSEIIEDVMSEQSSSMLGPFTTMGEQIDDISNKMDEMGGNISDSLGELSNKITESFDKLTKHFEDEKSVYEDRELFIRYVAARIFAYSDFDRFPQPLLLTRAIQNATLLADKLKIK